MKNIVKIKDGETVQLTKKQKAFCELYVSKTEFFANGSQSYIEAYGLDANKSSALSSASRLLTNDNVLQYMDYLIELNGLNDQFVDKQLEFLITQNADFSVKLGAIKEYNKIKQRITKNIKVLIGKDVEEVWED